MKLADYQLRLLSALRTAHLKHGRGSWTPAELRELRLIDQGVSDFAVHRRLTELAELGAVRKLRRVRGGKTAYQISPAGLQELRMLENTYTPWGKR
jgi:hypothetical protein